LSQIWEKITALIHLWFSISNSSN